MYNVYTLIQYIYIYIYIYAGSISKNLTHYKTVHQTKLTFGKCSSLLILQQQLSHGQNKVKNGNFLK